jgi:hypothetical protein
MNKNQLRLKLRRALGRLQTPPFEGRWAPRILSDAGWSDLARTRPLPESKGARTLDM